MRILSEEKRKARKMTREEARSDLEMYLRAIYHGEQTNDRELVRSSEKDLRKTEKILVYQTFYQNEEKRNGKTV